MAITLRAARVNKNLTQEEAAAALKIATKTLWNYEKGIYYVGTATYGRGNDVCGETKLGSGGGNPRRWSR